MKASVIIPTKNPGLLFQRVLSRVLDQVVPWDFEVLVIDSGSNDGTIEYVKNFQLKSPRLLRLLEIPPESFGHGRTRNRGVQETTGDFIVLITHDALPCGLDWLAQLVTAAEADESIAGVFGRHEAYPDTDPFTQRELQEHFLGFVVQPVVSLLDRTRYNSDPGYRRYLHFFSDNNALIRRSVWQSIPYPDVDFAEDQIWAKKIIEAGYKKSYAHQAPVFHSHNYRSFERLQRSYDESHAFFRLFGYTLCPSLRAMFRSWMSLNLRNFRWFLSSPGMLFSWPTSVLLSPLDNLMRVMGHYLGSRADRLGPRVRSFLSRDKRLMRGLKSVRSPTKTST
ncbi:MAG: glycosyltransferase [Bdellovibrionales bacterium]|nr:glycosyltransferase [Bdellovibrionales bacterium]